MIAIAKLLEGFTKGGRWINDPNSHASKTRGNKGVVKFNKNQSKDRINSLKGIKKYVDHDQPKTGKKT